jgi:hypothetical protein
VRSKAPERPKLGPLVPVIDAILEADKTALPKQRHTAKRIFERLRIEHGYAFGYTVVKDYVRITRADRARSSSRSSIRPATRRSRRAHEAARVLFRPAAVGRLFHQGQSGGDHRSLILFSV